MNIEFANTIPLSEILIKIGLRPAKGEGDRLCYLSPLRDEKTPSFFINTKLNKWFDFGENSGGDVVRFVCEYLRSQNVDHSVSDALRWLENMMGYALTIKPVAVTDYFKENSALKIRNVGPIENRGLEDYLTLERCINLDVAKRHLKQLELYSINTKRSFISLGLINDEGGYEHRNRFGKGTVKTKYVTFIRGTDPDRKGIHIFEGFMDYLSIITRRKGEEFQEDTLILNSLSCLKLVRAYLYKYGYTTVYTWLDNDAAGEKALQSLSDYFPTETGLNHIWMNQLYADYKDVNEWHVATLKPANN